MRCSANKLGEERCHRAIYNETEESGYAELQEQPVWED